MIFFFFFACKLYNFLEESKENTFFFCTTMTIVEIYSNISDLAV